MPRPFRVLAVHARLLVNRSTGRIPGGSLLHRTVARLYRRLGIDTEACLTVAGRRIFLDLCDPRMFWVLEEARGEGAEFRILRDLLGAGDTFLDIGANHGAYSLHAAALTGPSGYVIAIEPNPLLAGLLRKTLAANATGRWEVIEAACGDRTGERTLYVPRLASSGSSNLFGSTERWGATSMPVKVAPLDALVDGGQLAGRVVVKLDVEGAELAFVRGARELLSSRRPPMLIEISPDTAAHAGFSHRDLVSALQACGYSQASELDAYPARIDLAGLAPRPQRNVLVV